MPSTRSVRLQLLARGTFDGAALDRFLDGIGHLPTIIEHTLQRTRREPGVSQHVCRLHIAVLVKRHVVIFADFKNTSIDCDLSPYVELMLHGIHLFLLHHSSCTSLYGNLLVRADPTCTH